MGRRKKTLEKIGRRWHRISNTLATPLLGKPSDAPIWRVFFFLRNSKLFHRLKYQKRALTFDQQLDLLTSRGLVVDDRERALRWLSRVNYYRLSAYLYPFRLANSDDYKPGTRFEEIAQFYLFDRRLRSVLMDAIQQVEVWLRTQITYELAHLEGPFGYLKKTNFNPNFDHREFLKRLADEIERSKEDFVRHYKRKYSGENHLPVWMATEILTFGSVSVLYSEGLSLDTKRKIAQRLGEADNVVTSWMQSLTYIRNLCAHHCRLWNRDLAVSPKIPKKNGVGKVDEKRIYRVLLALQIILNRIAPNSTWKGRVYELIDSHPGIDLSQMGFPSDWKTRYPWNVVAVGLKVDVGEHRLSVLDPPAH
jgi:abortive infection bacteriophage resistance protein